VRAKQLEQDNPQRWILVFETGDEAMAPRSSGEEGIP
jgi:hypothetical protein